MNQLEAISLIYNCMYVCVISTRLDAKKLMPDLETI